MIVVDASALAAFIFKEPGWRDLSKYLVNAISLDMIVKEVTNAIWKAYSVRKYMGLEEAYKLFNILNSMINVNIILKPENDYMNKAFNIAVKYNITVYDALYIALSMKEDKPLLTLDKRQLKTAQKLGVRTMKHFH